jgi:hypothetical protein
MTSTQKQTKFSRGKTNGGRNNTSNEVRYIPKNAHVVGLMRPEAFSGLRSQLHIAHHQSLEGVNR